MVPATLNFLTERNCPTKRAPDTGDSVDIPSSFTHLIIFMAGRLRRPRPAQVTQAVGWLANQGHKIKNQRSEIIMKKIIVTILLFIMLSACSQAIETSFPAETLQPTIAPIVTEMPETPTPMGACPAETANLKLFINSDSGYCFLYPIEDTPLPPYIVVVNPNGVSGGDFLPGDALVQVSIEAASGNTVAQIVDQKITEAGEGFNITRSEILIDGKQAIVVDGLPAQDPWREVFIVDNDRLYHMFFQPWIPNAEWFSELEKLYSSVIDSFHIFQPVP